MNNKVKIGLVIFLISCSLIFFFLHYREKSTPQHEKAEWSFKIKPNNPSPTFMFKANKVYTVYSQYGFHSFSVNGLSVKSNIPTKTRKFTISFQKETKVDFDCHVGSFVTKTGRLKIREIQNINYPRVVFVKPNRYTGLFKVSKGMRFNLTFPLESFYLGEFKNGKLKDKSLVKRPALGPNYYHGMWFNFYDDREIKLKAAEVPFFYFINGKPYVEKLEIQYGTKNDIYMSRGGKKSNKSAFYLNPGEIIKTAFWLDKGDWACIGNKSNYNKFTCSVDGKVWENPIPHNWATIDVAEYQARRTGYLRIKANKQCVINKIILYHDKKWKLNLKTNNSRQIKVFSGDILYSRSGVRYYVDGKILDRNQTYIHKISKDRSLKFKGSIDPAPIQVWVFSRRGY